MPVRIKDGIIPYTWWQGIEITDNHVINVLLRALNNLIHVNENRELYVDLQLMDNILPSSDFPVGVTTGKVLQANGWQQSWLILNRKTTSGDYCRWIYANDGKLYYDPWTWVWNQVFLSSDVADLLVQIQNLVDVALDNYYTKTEVDNLIGSLTSISLVILNDVSDLPSVWDTNKIYLVPNSNDPSIYDEYVWDTTNQTWIIIWTTAVNLADYVTINTNQTITWTKTFSSEPILPNKTADATNNGTKPATEAQVYKVAQSVPTKVSDLTNDSWYITSWALWNGKIIINQWWSKKWEFTVNQSGNTTIDLDAWWGWWWWGWASVSDTSYWPSWDWVTNVAPSKNAVYDKIESIVSWSSQVKVWNYPMAWFSQAQLEEICAWCILEWHSAIIKWRDHDSQAPLNLYIFWNYYEDQSNVKHFLFYWMWEYNNTTDGCYTTRYNWSIEIQADSGTYTLVTSTQNYQVAWNYISVTPSDYTTAFIPTYDYQPATKWYVDSRNWVGTQAQYNQLTPENWVIYNIIAS